MVLEIVLQDTYHRLLAKLLSSPAPLLGASALGRDFFHSWLLRRPTGSGCSAYLLPNNDSFHPMLLGTVATVDDSGSGVMSIVLRLPSGATFDMEDLFSKQISCLSNVVRARCDLTPEVACEDVIPFSYGDNTSDGRIHLSCCSDTIFRVSTPRHCLDGVLPSSDSASSSCSTSSSSTMSSTNYFVSTAPKIEVADLLVVRCTMSCQDFPRPQELVMRVFSLVASDVILIV
ncbi:hypothetical protein C8F04DRAFT_1268533 [Mycena alexandri]|uniref:Uncharacterized protein n=1 Tax=Mycena alexandri TaxID=1745969 RepID=A0AAD6WUV3_9AGAR|nr:hypothetical protein C8F04DRAFT_1277922 [Mycena alexandri]KAJ7026062.1 hypothetical protein C8F04DRAFT_1268533 [Mycena alexandri]